MTSYAVGIDLGGTNIKGGGLNYDAFVLCDDPTWTPHGTPPAPPEGKHMILVHAETFVKFQGKELSVKLPASRRYWGFDPGSLKPTCVGNQVSHAAGPVTAPHGRDMAEGTWVIAALCNLKKGVALGRENPGLLVIIEPNGAMLVGKRSILLPANGLDDGLKLIKADKGVNLRDLALHFFRIDLDHTPGDHEAFDLPLAFGLCDFQYLLKRLSLGIRDETAGVDDDDLGLRRVGGHLEAGAR